MSNTVRSDQHWTAEELSAMTDLAASFDRLGNAISKIKAFKLTTSRDMWRESLARLQLVHDVLREESRL